MIPSSPKSPSVGSALDATVISSVSALRLLDHVSEADINGKTFVCYRIEVTGVAVSGTAMQWLVKKRYTEFLDLYNSIYGISKNTPEVAAFIFPRKSLFHNQDSHTIERRKKGFEDLLQLAFAVQPRLLVAFLRVSAPELCGHQSDTPVDARPPPICCSPDVLRVAGTTSSNDMSSPIASFSIQGESTGASIETALMSIPEEEPVEFSRALLKVLRIEAFNLKKVEFLGDNNPFITLAFDKWRGRTKTLKNAGQSVSWKVAGDKKFEFDVTVASLESMQLRVAAHDDNDISSSKEIGHGGFSLSSSLVRGLDVENSVEIELVDAKSKFAGKIIVHYMLVDHPDDVADNEKRIQHNGVIFALFYIILYEACLLIYVLVSFDFGTLYDLLMWKLKRELLRLMFCSQLLLILVVVFLFSHRFLGWALTTYLRNIMGTPSGGYAMEFGWLSLRLGLDESEIVLKNFVWRNPAMFKESPFFVKIKRMCIRFDPSSIYPAFMRNSPIQISDIELNGVTAYVERDTKYGLNIWACMGANDQTAEETSIESSVVGNVSHAMKKIKKSAGNVLPGTRTPKRIQAKKKATGGVQDGSSDSGEDELEDHEKQQLHSGQPSLLSSPLGKPPSAKTNGWGVPYKFITGRLEIRNLRAHAQDYLNARHSGYSNLTSIHIKRLEMNKKELCDYSSSQGYRAVWLDDLVWKLIGELILSLLASNSGSLALLAGGRFVQTLTGNNKCFNDIILVVASAAASNTFALAVGTTGMATKGVMESLHNYNPSQVMGSTFKMTTGLFKGQKVVEQDDELRALGFDAIVGRVISVRNLKRKGKAVDKAYCTLALMGSEVHDQGTYKTYVRSGEPDLSVKFDEAFELKPLMSLSQGLSIKIFDKKLARVVTADKLIVEHIIPNLRDELIIGRGAEVATWIELGSDGMFDDTGEILLALQLVKNKIGPK